MEEKVSREINIFGEINDRLAEYVIEQLQEIYKEDLEIFLQNEKLKKKNRIPYEPIKININSGGGSIFAGIGIIDQLQKQFAEIYCHASGVCASMAFQIYVNTDYRSANELISFGLHGSSCGYYSTYIPELKNDLVNLERIDAKLNQQVMENTKITKKELKECSTCLKWYGYEEAVEKGIVNLDMYDLAEDEELEREIEESMSTLVKSLCDGLDLDEESLKLLEENSKKILFEDEE